MRTVSNWADDIHLIGLGGIGTEVLMTLIKLGARQIHVWDDDIVSAHNRPTQSLYSREDIGRSKVEGVQRFVQSQGYDVTLIPHTERVGASTALSGIVISGVDDMENRRQIWEAVLAAGGFVTIYIDGRILNEYMWVLTVDPTDPEQAEKYASTLAYDPKSSAEASCTTRQNPHSAMAVAMTVSVHLTLVLEGEPVKLAVYRNLRRDARPTSKQLAETSSKGSS